MDSICSNCSKLTMLSLLVLLRLLLVNPQGLSEGDTIRYCNIHWLHNETLGLMSFLARRSQGHSGFVGGGGASSM